MKKMKIFSGSSNESLAKRIAKHLDLELSPAEIFVFLDGERRIRILTSVVDEDTILVQPTATPVDQNYMELFFIADGLRRSGARSITVVIPYLGYQRQDHVFRDGEAVSLEVIVHALESVGIDKVIAFDFHTIKTPEIFSIPVTHLSALSIFSEEIKKILNSKHEARSTKQIQNTNHNSDLNSVLVSPDMGGLRRIKIISEMLNGMPWIATVKNRDLATGEIKIDSIESPESGLSQQDLKGRKAFIVDDMASSGGTLIESAKLLKINGVEEIYAFVTHPIFSENAPKLLQESVIKKVYVTDSVYVPEEKKFPKLEIISIAELVAEELKSKFNL